VSAPAHKICPACSTRAPLDALYCQTCGADVRDVDFSKLMEQLEVSPNAIVAWTLAGGFDLQGTCDPLDLRGKLDMPTREFRVTRDAWHAEVTRPVIQVQRAHLVGQVRVRPAGIFLEQVDIALPASRLFVDRVLLGFDNELEIHAQALDWTLSDSSPLLTFPLGGRGTFTLDVTGTFSDPVIAGQVAARDFTFNGYRFGDIVTEFTVDEDLMGVRFVSLEATKQDSRYRLRDGFLDFRDDRFRTGAQVEIARMTLADFYHVFHWEEDERYEPYTGEVEGTVGVAYTLGFPDDSANGTMIADIDLADVRRERITLPLLRDERPELVAREWRRLIAERAGLATDATAEDGAVDGFDVAADEAPVP